MSSSKREFNVIISAEEYLQLCSWVLKHEHIETGGDLFGLWADDRTAVIQLVVGPGKNCRRTSVSFYQDVDYLKEVGSYLTCNEGLCHIGEWHSHHQLGLAQPSVGDEGTVWRNMPTYGLERFVIFIANLEKDSENMNANVGCFLFEIDEDTGKRMRVLQGQFCLVNNSSPIRSKVESSCFQNEIRAIQIFNQQCESLNRDEDLRLLSVRQHPSANHIIVSKKRKQSKPKTGGSNNNQDGTRRDQRDSVGESRAASGRSVRTEKKMEKNGLRVQRNKEDQSPATASIV